MIIIILTIFLVAADDICIQNSYLNIGQPIDAIGDKALVIRLQGEFLVGYGDDYHILDKNKILLIPQEDKAEYRAINLEVYCPGIHLIQEQDDTQCEIVLNLLTKSDTEYKSAILVLPVEEDDEIRTNPLLKIDQDFEIHLSDLAEQLDDMSYYLEYVNCGSQYYLLPNAIEITAEQMALVIQYSTQLPDDAPIVDLETYQGTLRVENFTINKGSNVHLYGLVVIIAGVLILTAIRAFKKHEEPQQQNQQQLMEMPKLG